MKKVAASTGKQKDGKYFTSTKRGEIQELKEELHSSDKTKQKDAVKKVIASMTVGKDVSALFADVVNTMQTENLELKKLVYLYIMNYAKAQPELAILAINTFRKDACDSNPLIRSLAVRTMGCIRLDQVTEYLLEPLRKCCTDPDPYVRKTAAICIPKVYEINSELVAEQGFLDVLKDMLSDPNPMVVANAVAGIAEITDSSGEKLLDLEDRGTIPKLLAALNECNEWGQVFILDALATYKPSDSGDAESITERITARLSHANPAVVLAGIKVVLRCMDYIDSSEINRVLCKKLNAPLVTLLSCEPEVQFVALRNIRLILQKQPGILSADVKMFFCKYNDPAYVKMEKIDVLVVLVSERNAEQVLLELKEYATGVDVDFCRKSVHAIGRVAVKLERAAERAISVVLELIETKVSYLVQEAAVVLKDIFRKYPSRYEKVLSALCESMEVLDEPEAKASLIWILGEYAERIEGVEDFFEQFLDTFHDEEVQVQAQLLTAIVKLFLKKPNTTQDMVAKVLKCATEESNCHDLRDRGYIYWRLLSTNPEATKHVVLGDKPTIKDDSQVLDRSLLDRLVADLSLVSSVYHKTADEFITRVETKQAGDLAAADDDEEIDEETKEARRRDVQQEMEAGPTPPAASGCGLDLLDLDSGDGGGGGGSGGGGDILGGGDLLGGGPTFPASAPVAVQKTVALQPTQPGQGGKPGLGVAAAVCREGGSLQLKMAFSNHSQAPIGGFAIQVNKNPFGIAPAAALTSPDVMPGANSEVSLLMNPNQVLSNTAPTNPLFLQMAIKTSLDVFYFNVVFDLPAVLLETTSVDRNQFTSIWQTVGEMRQHIVMGNGPAPMTADMIKSKLAMDNIHHMGQRQAEDSSVCVYVASSTVNNCVILGELMINASAVVKIATRSETPALVPLFEAAVCKRLGLSVP